MAKMGQRELMAMLADWTFWGRTEQHPPETDWSIWLFLGGRGAGKTRAGAEWVSAQVRAGCRRVALVAPTLGDAREVMVDGPSGLKQVSPWGERPVFEVSRRRLVWPNGAIGYVFSAEDADSLRGPQFDCAWADEFAAWAAPQATLDNLRLGLRLGDNPRLAVTTTPRPIPALKRLITQPGVAVTRGGTAQNANNLAPGFLAAMEASYGGSRLGRQELDGELIEDPPGALWTRDDIEAAITGERGDFDRIVVAVDPPASAHAGSDECGIVVAGARGSGPGRVATILADKSFGPASPEAWARVVAQSYEEFEADRVVAEVNQGGDMVMSVLAATGAGLPVSAVRASRGKHVRAEPVAALYAAGRVKHTGRFRELEDQMCAFGAPDAPKSSPDRVDALVWAVSVLLLNTGREPRLRRL
ncbi:DNA-packaging protein [Hyphobacterium marinum]|uniref:Terminase family protein n=1 Tax=Hyphobacterium marinum TaxID=3116574 RepID=A0ABU7M0L9_9PROT|nr:terminase family protein [Hyphobacterium sp. Y6023]MEE2567336.1 terminase family protein [Hyphobacterium sp. Y6023]